MVYCMDRLKTRAILYAFMAAIFYAINVPVSKTLLREVGPMAVSSANISGRPPAVTAGQARDQLGDLVEVYLDAGPVEQQAPSTIVDVTGAHPRILRAGPISADDIARVLEVDVSTLSAETE